MMNETLELIFQRASLRKYDERPITVEDKNLILQSALRAPTAGNMMLYSIIDVTDQEMKETLSHTCDNQPFITTAPMVLVFLADYQRWYDYYAYSGVKEFMEGRGEAFLSPGYSEFMLGANDAIIAAQNTVIAAESLGIGSCYIGDIMENYETHRDLFKLPEWTFPVCMLCYGYFPNGRRPKTRERLPIENIVSENTYRVTTGEEFAELIKERTASFSVENKFGAENYGQQHYAGKTGSDFSKEMERSIRAALENWTNYKL